MTKKSADINYISKDLFPKTYNRTMTDDDYIKQLEQENKQLKEVINKAIEYIKEKQKNQYKFALSHIECDDLLEILKEVSE